MKTTSTSSPLKRHRIAPGVWLIGNLTVRRNLPPRNTGHKLVATWVDVRTNKMVGYTLDDVEEVARARAAAERYTKAVALHAIKRLSAATGTLTSIVNKS